MAVKKKKPPESPAKRVPLSLRVTPAMKESLEEAAGKNGRSLTQEIELRLERSFERQDLLRDMLEIGYGRHLAGMVMLIANTARIAGMAAHATKGAADAEVLFDPTWLSKCLSDPWTFAEIQTAITVAVQSLKPAGDDKPDADVARALKANGWSSLGGEFGTVAAALLRARRLGDDNWIADNLSDLLFKEDTPK